MCTTHDRIAQVCDHVRANPERYADFTFYPCMPYAHKYANAVTEDGMLGAVKRFLPDEGLVDAAHPRRRARWRRRTSRAITTLLIDAEMKMFEGLRTPVIFLQNVVVDLLLGLGFKDAFRIFADHVQERYDAEPGFITMNLPALLATCSRRSASRTRSSAPTSTRSASACAAGSRPTSRRCASAGSARSRCRSSPPGAIPPSEAIEWVCAQPNLESIVFGASSARQHPAAPATSCRTSTGAAR